MSTLLHHFYNEALYSFHLQRRYLLHTVLASLMLIFIFAGLIGAVLSLSQKSMGTGIADGLIVGFAVWLFAASAYSSTSNDVAEFMHSRSIEHAFMAAVPFVYLLAVRAIIQIILGVFSFVFVVLIVHLVLGERSRIEFVSMFFACLVAAPSLFGVGLVVAGILLFMKRAEALHAFSQLALLGLVALPAYPANILAFLPFSLGAAAARAAGAGEHLSHATFLLIALNSVVYLFLGFLFFSKMERGVRARGILGHI